MIIFISLGIIASIFQLVILREFSFSIAKNELGFIIAAGFWILFCALGSLFKTSKKLQMILPLLFSLIFSLSIYLIHLLKYLTGFKYYETINLNLVLFAGLVLIGPTALAVGLAFKEFTQEYTKRHLYEKNIYAKFIAFEAIGFLIAGGAFTLYLNEYANPFIFSFLPLILLPVAKKQSKKIILGLLIIIVALISFLSFNFVVRKEFNNAGILFNLGSHYGPVISTRAAGVTSLFSAGSLLATSEDKSANEEFIHMSLSAADPQMNKDILFIGADFFGQIDELTQYKINSLDLLQINPLIFELAKQSVPARLKDKINFIPNDPRLYLENSNKKYDAILMRMPPPSNLALNRYFTEDFFRLVLACLKTNGIFSFTIPSKRDILSPGYIKFNSSIINAVNKVFANRFIIPSDSMIIIASGKQEFNRQHLLDNFSQAQLKLEFFTIYHFRDYLDQAIQNYTENMLDKKVPPNTDLDPSGFLNYLALEQSKFYPNLRVDFNKIRPIVITILLCLGLFIIAASCLSKKTSSMLNIGVIGFTSISLSSIIFILFQLYCGALFWKFGVLIALFMAGLSAGILLMNTVKNYQRSFLSVIYFGWIIIIFILFFNLKTIGRLTGADFIFYLYSLICGFLTGNSYPLLARNLLKNEFNHQNIAVTIYSVDLTGAFLGTIVSGVLLIPFLGISDSLLALIFLNAIFALRNLRG